jgi:hypothetical protein
VKSLNTSNVFIYALACPETNEVRYVGKSTNPRFRLRSGSGHIGEAKRGDDTHRGRWIRSLLARGLEPRLIILEEVVCDEWEEAERRWIAHYRGLCGDQLTNHTDGGDGARGHDEATRRKMSLAKIGKRRSIETRRKIAEASRQRSHGEEARNKISAAHRGRVHSLVSRANMSAAHLGHKPTAEAIEKARISNTGRRRAGGALANVRAGSASRFGLTPEQVIERAKGIISQHGSGKTQRQIAKEFGVSSCTVCYVLSGSRFPELHRPWMNAS